MGRSTISLLILLGLLLASNARAQTYKVSDPRPELVGNTIHIHFDILNSSSDDEFSVKLSVVDDQGKEIPARTLAGDVGEHVKGGSGKVIRWDLSVDQIEMEAHIYFRVHANYIAPPEPEPVIVVPPVEEEKEEIPVEEKLADKPAKASHEMSRGGIIVQSLAFPGLGLTRMTGNPHWIRGVLAYGCLAGSFALNRSAINTYNQIYDISDTDRREELYNKSLAQDQTSEILAYSAAAIWLADIVWNLVGTSPGRGFSMRSAIDPLTSAPMVVLTYRF